MNPAISLIGAAFLLGAVSGLSPGPLLTLVVAESIRKGFRSGIAVSVAPLITDAPIVLVMTLLADTMASIDPMIGSLYLCGACYLVYLTVEMLRFRGRTIDTPANFGASFMKGAFVNLLNPAPYLFWISIGAPLLVQAKSISWTMVPMFLVFFYSMLVGMKILLAVLVAKNRHVLAGGAYTVVMRVMGILLLFFAVVFLKNGIERFL